MDGAVHRARDEWLAVRCKLRRPGAFADLIRLMERPLLYYAAKLLRDDSQALDVLQEIWVQAFRSIQRLDDPSRLRSWLYRIAHGIVVDRIRQDVSRERAERAWSEAAGSADEQGFPADDAAAIHRALDELDAKHREVLVLHFLEEISIAEIATVIGCPEGTVKSRIYHAKRALREVLLRGGYGTP